jgi:hypothetical protein
VRVTVDTPTETRHQVVGVFAVDEPVHGMVAQRSGFCYTVGAQDICGAELWCPTASVEGRYVGPHLITDILNMVVAALRDGEVRPGGDLFVPLATPEQPDVAHDAVFWLGLVSEDLRGRLCFLADRAGSSRLIPMSWSSPLGWPTSVPLADAP